MRISIFINSLLMKLKFLKNHHALTYWFMKDIDKATYINFLNNIEKFLNSEQGYKFSCQSNAEIFLKEIT